MGSVLMSPTVFKPCNRCFAKTTPNTLGPERPVCVVSGLILLSWLFGAPGLSTRSWGSFALKSSVFKPRDLDGRHLEVQCRAIVGTGSSAVLDASARDSFNLNRLLNREGLDHGQPNNLLDRRRGGNPGYSNSTDAGPLIARAGQRKVRACLHERMHGNCDRSGHYFLAGATEMSACQRKVPSSVFV